MKNNQLVIIAKIFLGVVEVVYVGGLCFLRVLNIGWLLIIFGLVLVLWVVVHLGLMTALITSFKTNWMDISLYLAVHFFYLWAWLLQVDGGDTGPILYTLQKIINPPGLTPFLEKWGDHLFWVTAILTLVCYVLIGILLARRWVKYLKDRKDRSLVKQP